MKTVSKLSLLLVALTLVACNEKVTPELDSSAVTTTTGGSSGGGPTVVPDEYYFRVVNASADILNYKVHKTGTGNLATPCEVKTTIALSSTAFINSPATYDITCYMEAEELALNYAGISLQVEASANTCEAVAYSPYSYYNRIPGDSTGTYTKVTCTNEETTDAHVVAIDSANASIDLATNSGTDSAKCGQFVSDSLPATRLAFSQPDSEAELCRFNYQDGKAEACDSGIITINELQVTFDTAKADAAGVAAGTSASQTLYLDYTDLVDGDGAGPDDGLETISTAEQAAIDALYNPAYQTAYDAYPPTYKMVPSRQFSCGGTSSNCVAGPLKTHSELNSTKGTLYQNSVYDTDYTRKFEYKPNGLFINASFQYANFRRNLANAFIAYGTTPGNSTYNNAFNSTYGSVFDPNLVDRYSKNMLSDNSSNIIDSVTWDGFSVENNMYTARKLAADPFMGLSYNGTSNRVNPFYEFICYDNAWEMKSRIRLMVRDWDRLVPTNTYQELISDIFRGSSGSQDNTYVEYPDNIPFDDAPDWDDWIPMVRDASSTPAIYAPYSGFFDPDNFPNINSP